MKFAKILQTSYIKKTVNCNSSTKLWASSPLLIVWCCEVTTKSTPVSATSIILRTELNWSQMKLTKASWHPWSVTGFASRKHNSDASWPLPFRNSVIRLTEFWFCSHHPPFPSLSSHTDYIRLRSTTSIYSFSHKSGHWLENEITANKFMHYWCFELLSEFFL